MKKPKLKKNIKKITLRKIKTKYKFEKNQMVHYLKRIMQKTYYLVAIMY